MLSRALLVEKSATLKILQNVSFAKAFSVKREIHDVETAVKFVNKAQIVDFKFVDLRGTWQHVQVAAPDVDEGTFENGLGFDGSSIGGWQPIHKSDMLLIPEPLTGKMEPFTKHPTASFICRVVDPDSKANYHKDPRAVAKLSLDYLNSSGIASDCRIGPEAEFFVFDGVRYGNTQLSSFFEVQSSEHSSMTHEFHSKNYKLRPKGGYYPVMPWDSLQDLRSEMVIEMLNLGLHVEASHHEVAAPGQCEIDIRYDSLVDVADSLMWYKHVVRNVAARHDKIVTFMPKPIPEENGSGMHTHVSLHDKNGKNMFQGNSSSNELSEMAKHFVGGLIKHSAAVCAFTNPTLNSYKRLVPGFEAPTTMAYSGRNRSAAIRIPISHPKATRIEFRTPDTSANPYLAFSAILMAGLDGIEQKMDPGLPFDKNIYALSEQELATLPQAPTNLNDALAGLEKDHDFLQKGNVFSDDLLQTWVSRKRELEIDPNYKIPTPLEYELYFDC